MSSDDLFFQVLEGVVPLEHDRAHVIKKAVETPGKRVRRKLAAGSHLLEDPLASADVPLLKSNDILELDSKDVFGISALRCNIFLEILNKIFSSILSNKEITLHFKMFKATSSTSTA